MRKILLSAATFVSATLLCTTLGFGQDKYPSRPITIIVPYAAGGASDQVARVLCQQLTQDLGQGCVVENRIGGTGVVGYQAISKAAPDGYTLGMADPSFSIIPNWFQTLPFDNKKDFTAVSQVIASPTMIVIRPDIQAKTLQEFIALARANPGKFKYGSAGLGGAPYMWAEQFKVESKTDIKHIAYKGAGESVPALLGGEIDMIISTIPTVAAMVQSGKLRALAVTGQTRVPGYENVPTFKEAGLPGMSESAFMGLIGPAGIPKNILEKLDADVKKAISTPAVKERFATMGSVGVGNTADEFRAHIDSETKKWGVMMKESGIKPQAQ
jgi:tripartite-type tricarboxylate transporter receptor subunit TctC